MLERVDHLVYAARDLEAAVDGLERLLGVRASAGGRHPGEGTRNALIALGPRSYLEVVAGDPEAPALSRPRWFGIDALKSPRLVAWAARGEDLECLAVSAGRSGVPLGPVRRGGRVRSDGAVLSWSLTDPSAILEGGVVPFFIDWGDSPHPAETSAPGCRLVDFSAEHPEPDQARRALRALGIALRVERGSRPALVALVESPKGTLELR